jgi:HD domain
VTEDRPVDDEGQFNRYLGLVTQAHQGQVDKAGRPYIEHLLDVSRRAVRYGESARLAGLLHDVLEDTETTVDDLRRADVPDDVVHAVQAVTRRPDESYDQFIDRVVRDGGLALQVKHADLESNLGRLDGIGDEATRQRLRAKYEPAVAKVEAALAVQTDQSEG